MLSTWVMRGLQRVHYLATHWFSKLDKEHQAFLFWLDSLRGHRLLFRLIVGELCQPQRISHLVSVPKHPFPNDGFALLKMKRYFDQVLGSEFILHPHSKQQPQLWAGESIQLCLCHRPFAGRGRHL